MSPGADEPVGPAPLPELRDGTLSLRPARHEDREPILAMLAEPEVYRWWGDYAAHDVEAELDPGTCWAIRLEDATVGWLQANEETSPNYRSVAFDIALAGPARGRGLGRRALRLAIEHFITAGHHRFTIDPALANQQAIRAYRGLGFRPVGTLRRYERAPDGVWRDGLLMELLADELPPVA